MQGSRSHDITLEFSLLRLGDKLALRDLWARKDLGTFSGR